MTIDLKQIHKTLHTPYDPNKSIFKKYIRTKKSIFLLNSIPTVEKAVKQFLTNAAIKFDVFVLQWFNL